MVKEYILCEIENSLITYKDLKRRNTELTLKIMCTTFDANSLSQSLDNISASIFRTFYGMKINNWSDIRLILIFDGTGTNNLDKIYEFRELLNGLDSEKENSLIEY